MLVDASTQTVTIAESATQTNAVAMRDATTQTTTRHAGRGLYLPDKNFLTENLLKGCENESFPHW